MITTLHDTACYVIARPHQRARRTVRRRCAVLVAEQQFSGGGIPTRNLHDVVIVIVKNVRLLGPADNVRDLVAENPCS